MLTFEDLVINLQKSDINQDQTLRLFVDKLCESSRRSVKRCRERCLDEAVQLLKKIPETKLHALEENGLLLLVQLLMSLQLLMVDVSTACRKLDQMLQHLAKVNHQLVFRETQLCLKDIMDNHEILSFEDLQKACMLLEDSSFGREVWRGSFLSLMDKVCELLAVVQQQDSLRDGPLCYLAVKVCLQMFQLLSGEVAPLVWKKEQENQENRTLQKILQVLMDIILGQCSNRDTRLLAGTAVAMLINTSSDSRAAGAAAWRLLQVSAPDPWLLAAGLQVNRRSSGKDGVERLAMTRGLLTCCRPHVLLAAHPQDTQRFLLLDAVFPLVYSLCEEQLDCRHLPFELLTLWMKKVKECLAEIWKMTNVRLLPDDGDLLQQLIHIIWTNAESPVDGVSEWVRCAFSLLLELYELDCERFGDSEKILYVTLLQRIIKLPWENKAKYHRLGALLPYLGTDVVLDQDPEIPDHLLRCLSTNHLSPCGSELYRTLIQQQRRELCAGSGGPVSEVDPAARWSSRWRLLVVDSLTSSSTLLQNHGATLLLPCTFQVFPAAVDPLLASVDPLSPGHLHAWACIMSCYRAATGVSPWALQGGSAPKTLRLALESAEDRVRLAGLGLVCCSLKTREDPTKEELEVMRRFIPQNLNCDSSPFRQHLQAAVKRFLVRIRDACLAHVRGLKGKKKEDPEVLEKTQEALEQGIGFVDWLGQLPFCYLAAGHSFQRKKTVLLLLSVVLETCTDTWSPDRKKGQPPVNMSSLINYARQRGFWDFFSRSKQLALLSCLEDSTNEIRELSAGLLLRFFPPGFPGDVAAVLLERSRRLLCSPRVQGAQTGSLMMKVLLHKTQQQTDGPSLVNLLVKELQDHYITAKTDMMLAARTKPIHGVLSALQRCLLQVSSSISDSLSCSFITELLNLLENITMLLLAVLQGDSTAAAAQNDAPPSFCDMGNAISSLINQASGNQDGEECILISEEHSLVLTCCWVSLKELGIFLGSLVERILTESKPSERLLTKEDLMRAAKVFQNILLKCRHWGAVEGCCVGFTRFCSSLLSSNDPEFRQIPADMLKQGLQVIRSPRSSSVTRRAAGLPMLILCVVSAEESCKTRPLLSLSVETLLETARTPIPDSWDQTLDLPQVCSVHTLQALVRGSGLGSAVLQFAPAVAILSLSQLSSGCWAMRNAALQLYSSLTSRMLGQRPGGEDSGPAQHAMSPAAFFFHYPALRPFLLEELRGAAQDLQGPPEEARLRLQPSLYPILTLLAQLQPGVQDSTQSLSDFLPLLLQLSSSPIYGVRAMAAKALVAMTPPLQYVNVLNELTARLPGPTDRCCHNQLHGQLLQIRAVIDRTLCCYSESSDDLSEVRSRVEAALWLATAAQRCPLVRGAYLAVAESLRGFCSEAFLSQLYHTLRNQLWSPGRGLQVGLSSFHQRAVHFLCGDQKWACLIWAEFPSADPDLRLALVTWAAGGRGLQHTCLKQVIQRVLQSNLRAALLTGCVEYRRTFIAALVTTAGDSTSSQVESQLDSLLLEDWDLLECLDLLLEDLEDQRGGPEFLSEALHAASLLLNQRLHHSVEFSRIQRWCSILERQRAPDAAEMLRRACAEALCVAGVSVMSRGLAEKNSLKTITIRLMDTALYLLQDQSPPVRTRAACFTSRLQHLLRQGEQSGVHLVQVNQAVLLLLDLLLQECWDSPGVLQVLLGHMTHADLRSVVREASHTGCISLYEQDEANVFSEPSVMSDVLLPYLLLLADRSSQSAALAQNLRVWAEENTGHVLENLRICKELLPPETLTPAWFSLLVNPCFRPVVSSLLTSSVFLSRLMDHLADSSVLLQAAQEVLGLLQRSGVHFPAAVTAALTAGYKS